jgi:hypothetical protein
MQSLLIAVAAVTVAATPTALEGGGVEVTVDLDGFKQDLGAGPMGKTYYRLGQFSLESASARSRAVRKPLVMSVLVDDVPPGVGMNDLRAHVLETQNPKPEVTATSAPPGFYFSYRQTIAEGFTQWHLYFHTLHEGKWVELHFSSLGRSPKTDTAGLEKLALEVVRSLHIVRKRAKL